MSAYIIPLILIILIIYGSHKKVNVYSCFTKGAKGSFELIYNIFPYIVAIMISVSLFRISGASTILLKIISPFFNFLGIPSEVCELVLLRPFTGSGSISLLENIISTYGADSYIARSACCILGSSETVFYVSAVYFADSKIKNIAPAIIVALIGNLVGATVSCLLCKII